MTEKSWIEQLDTDQLRHNLKGALTELMLIEEAMAEALEYPRSDGGPDDPNGGGFITGEHTALTLAMEAARKFRAERSSRQAWAAEALRLDEELKRERRITAAYAEQARGADTFAGADAIHGGGEA